MRTFQSYSQSFNQLENRIKGARNCTNRSEARYQLLMKWAGSREAAAAVIGHSSSEVTVFEPVKEMD